MVSQFLHVLPRQTAVDVVARVLVPRGGSLDRSRGEARAMLQHLGLPERLWNVPPFTFSGGERQLVNLARGAGPAAAAPALGRADRQPRPGLDGEDRLGPGGAQGAGRGHGRRLPQPGPRRPPGRFDYRADRRRRLARRRSALLRRLDLAEPVAVKTYITSARLVLDDQIVDDGALCIDGEIIAAVCPASAPCDAREVDLQGSILMPGLVDIHSDDIEIQVEPRQSLRLPLPFAIVQMDRGAAMSGITTMYPSLSFVATRRARVATRMPQRSFARFTTCGTASWSITVRIAASK